MRCDDAQGFHISRPLPFDSLIRFLQDESRISAFAEQGRAPRTFPLRHGSEA
jgi:hypothetical protein